LLRDSALSFIVAIKDLNTFKISCKSTTKIAHTQEFYLFFENLMPSASLCPFSYEKSAAEATLLLMQTGYYEFTTARAMASL
jgi:hypothetical protein